MCIYDAENFHFRDALPIQPAVGLSRGSLVVGHEQQAVGMSDVHRYLSGAVAGKFVGALLWQKPQGFQILRRH